MCTSLSLVSKNNNVIFGRTMDFSHVLDPEIYIFPKNYEWSNILNSHKIKNKYKFIGTGQNISKLICADGMNEMGLGVAALYFQGYAKYKEPKTGIKLQIASIELVNFLLGNAKNVDDAINILKDINIVGVKDELTDSIAPLHWTIVDKNNNSIVVESTECGIQIYNNKIKVLTNSPTFNFQMTNLRNYLKLSNKQLESSTWNEVELNAFSQGNGSFGLPGDYTSPSRFVRTAFIKNFSEIPENLNETVNLCFNITKSVFIPKGVVMTNLNNPDYTQYTVFMNLNTGDYYFNSNENNNILKVNLNDEDKPYIVSLGKIKSDTYFLPFNKQ